MSLSVTTKHGKPFRRAGITFGPEPVIVSADELGKEFVKATSKLKAVTVGEALKAEPMLNCVEVPEPQSETPPASGKTNRGK